MLRILLVLTALSSFSVYASPIEQAMTMKERLRISLWVEGIESAKPGASNSAQVKLLVLPEEIERALSKM